MWQTIWPHFHGQHRTKSESGPPPNSVRVPPRGSEFPLMTLVPWYNSSTVAPLQMFSFFLLLPFSVLSGPAKLNSLLSPLISNTLLASHELSLEGMFLLHSKRPLLAYHVLTLAHKAPVHSPTSPGSPPHPAFRKVTKDVFHLRDLALVLPSRRRLTLLHHPPANLTNTYLSFRQKCP